MWQLKFAVTALGMFVLSVPAQLSSTSAQAAEQMAKPVEAKALIELFTSQGCSSCPPADKLLKKYVDRSDVIALTLPVDYWDNLGWKDTLASPRNTRRQYSYAAARGKGSVYTPQVIVNGMSHVVGSHQSEIDKEIAATSNKLARSKVPVRIWIEKGHMVIEASGAAAGAAAAANSATIWLATTRRQVAVKIRRGENRNRKIVYYNVVKDLTPVGMWHGKPVKVELAKHAVMNDGANGCVVFLQQGNAGPIIGAAELKHW